MQILDCEFVGESSRPLVVFVHGWPDDAGLWRPLANSLKDKFYCALVTLPGFERQSPSRAPDFPELTDRLAATVEHWLIALAKTEFFLVGHDWGAYLSYLFEARKPRGLKALVTMDVGPQVRPRNFKESAFIVSYQWYLIGAWALSSVVPRAGDALSRAFARYAGAPGANTFHASANALYFHFWRHALFGPREGVFLKAAPPSVPFLFLYGLMKPAMFHTEAWLKRVRERAENRVVELPHAGHWLMRDDLETTSREVRDWLTSLSPEVPR